ncbi:hypothetical protein PoB_004509400 [Plakobranchus ocellatus]|uniref:Uncharacterized protein n=1 Tax=Plakobranchus ocellatus TaxID=259542 RepID=A0AAV4BEP7_9GAST|nr:hypothetical protein PoB_004509400 [Plakobranchus ocellatus]
MDYGRWQIFPQNYIVLAKWKNRKSDRPSKHLGKDSGHISLFTENMTVVHSRKIASRIILQLQQKKEAVDPEVQDKKAQIGKKENLAATK